MFPRSIEEVKEKSCGTSNIYKDGQNNEYVKIITDQAMLHEEKYINMCNLIRILEEILKIVSKVYKIVQL